MSANLDIFLWLFHSMYETEESPELLNKLDIENFMAVKLTDRLQLAWYRKHHSGRGHALNHLGKTRMGARVTGHCPCRVIRGSLIPGRWEDHGGEHDS